MTVSNTVASLIHTALFICYQSVSPASSASLVDRTRKLTIEKGSATKTKTKPKAASQSAESSGVKQEIDGTQATEKSYWLLKAEPESRIENGVDVKFSIDDLAAKTAPEPWDGKLNYVCPVDVIMPDPLNRHSKLCRT